MSQDENNSNQQFQNPYQPYPYYYYPQASPAYYPYPAYYRQETAPPQQQQQQQMQQAQQAQQAQQQAGEGGMLPIQQSYIENILRLNQGEHVTVYMTFENNDQWNAQIFEGVIEAAGRDHLILSDPQSGRRYLLLMVYLDYVVFDGEINYAYPYGGNGQLANFPPR
ncbi:spore coat protein GerQ [Virgibacillus sp. NKC19-16]|uniref:spore coat protein GerQ n=1 Tax=Virgibacillus salidurans TaxID=2831673 RepID=UPI001F1C7764|nr:spore coat protein GerQ [Virgibacillus sp. NKC19-16]UJL46024.1 spore coat protein GerQ [Virgibacillus sp. NKC19-16]